MKSNDFIIPADEIESVTVRSQNSDVTKELLESMYHRSRMSMSEIAKELGCSAGYVCKKMKEFGIEAREAKAREENRYKYCVDGEVLREMYWDRGMSQPEIARELKCDRGTVHRKMEKLGIERRPSTKNKYNFTPSYGVDMAYVVGVYIGDGCVRKEGTSFRLKVIDRDFCGFTKEMLERVAEGVTEVKHRVAKYKGEDYDEYIVYCCNTDFASWLVFITDGKETIPDFCKSSKLNKIAFLEGIMDSEGWINKNYTCLIGMDSELVHEFIEMFESIGVKTGKLGVGEDGCYRFTINLRSLINSGFKFHIGRKQEKLEEYRGMRMKRNVEKFNKGGVLEDERTG